MKPQLRFKEFTDDWEENKLGDIAEKFDYGIGASAVNYDGIHKYIRITDINDSNHKFKNDDLKSPSEKDEIILSEYKVQENDILFARTGATTGKTYLYNLKDGNLYFAGFLIRVHITENIANSYFVYSQTLTSKYNKWVKVMSMRTGQPGINAKEYKKLKLSLPSLSEQEKIGEFFSLLDQRIEKEEEKLNLLKERKKGWMQKIFNQEIRFKDENGNDYPAWEEKKLEGIFQERNEKSSIGKLLSVSISKGVTKFNDSERRNNSNIECGNYKKVYVNDIAYNSMRMWQGALGVSNYVGIVSPAYTVITPRDNQDSVFWSYAFKIQHSLYQFKKYSQGLTSDTWNLKYPLLSQIKFFVPSLPEQEKIANFLSVQDELIEKEEEKLNLLKEQKKGLLQQMFV